MAAVACAAVVDAVRSDGPAADPTEPVAPEARVELVAQLRALGARGLLIACGRVALTLPELQRRDPPPCPVPLYTVSLPPGELERAARLHPRVPDRGGRVRVLVDDAVPLSQARVAAALSIRLGPGTDRLGPLSSIAFFEEGRLVPSEPYFRVTGGDLDASPRGTYVTQTPDVILRHDGSQVNLPQYLRDATSSAWSPDERFLALAGRYAITIVDVASLERFDRTGGGLRSVTIPQPADRLEWG